MKKISIVTIFVLLTLMLGELSSQNQFGTDYCTGTGIITVTAPYYCSLIDNAVSQYWASYAPIAAIVMLISFSIAIFIFLGGVIIKNERLRIFGVGEIYEALATVIIVCLFLFVAAVVFGFIPGLIIKGTDIINPYTRSLIYINDIITTARSAVSSLFYIAVEIRQYSSISVQFCLGEDFPLPGFAKRLLYYFLCSRNIPKFLSNGATYLFYIPAFAMIDLQLDAIMLLYGEFYLIVFFMYAAIPIFLIPGVLFRSFLPTRTLGGMMIAISIGFYMIMPTLFTVAFYFTHKNILDQVTASTNKLTADSSGTGIIFNAGTPGAPLVVDLDNVKNEITSYFISSLFFPSLIIAITYAVITQIAEFIGGMAQTSRHLRI